MTEQDSSILKHPSGSEETLATPQQPLQSKSGEREAEPAAVQAPENEGPPQGGTALIENETEGSTVTEQLGSALGPAVEFVNNFERQHARYWITRTLRSLGASEPVIQYIETPMTLALMLSMLYFALHSAVYGMMKATVLAAVILYHASKQSVSLVFSLLGVALHSVFTFIIVTIACVIIKTLFSFPTQGVQLLADASTWNREDWVAQATQAREQVETIRAGVTRAASNVDIGETFRTLRALLRQAKGTIRPYRVYLDGVKWKVWIWAIFWTACVRSFFSSRWRGKLVTGCVVAAVILVWGILKCCRRSRGRAGLRSALGQTRRNE
ncbi:hypothetical protein DFP72DRAFT_1076064 [Ephemerocybe angulata]|uniref:Uncharacterized protein n=1 Tax=Ephemerocybe angulata TaxID=980116 RepID=A0A8H6HH57_9AGAR|nr:hypothetical protein DFP72DRAFT_1076064 [Tulosesus angulatus]